MPTASSPILNYARAAFELLAYRHTPPRLRASVKYSISELRDSLPADVANRLDGIEAEAVIACFADSGAPVPVQSSDEENHPGFQRTRDEQQAISAGIAE